MTGLFISETYIISMTELVLNITGLVLNMTGFIISMTVLQITVSVIYLNTFIQYHSRNIEEICPAFVVFFTLLLLFTFTIIKSIK